MWWRAICWSLISLALGAQASPAAEVPAPLVVTSYREFAVPFAVDPQETAKFVQLLVSNDRGQTWNVADTVAPTAGEFRFQAPFLGEFWFCIRTVDAAGRVSPATTPVTELRVRLIDENRAALTAAEMETQPPTPPRNEEWANVNGRSLDEIRPRMLNSRTFEIDYDAPSGESRPREVAVWLTSDGGAHWKRHGVDEDRVSPARVTVDRDGVYGLWIVVQDAAGRSAGEPRQGDQPGVWIGVDTTRPRAQLRTAEISVAQSQPELTVRWEASDARLSMQPITLSIRDPQQSLWTVAAKDVWNTGVHSLRIDPNWPAAVLVRMEVRDEAGNVETVETSEPVSTVVRTTNRGGSLPASDRTPRTYQILR